MKKRIINYLCRLQLEYFPSQFISKFLIFLITKTQNSVITIKYYVVRHLSKAKRHYLIVKIPI